MWKKLINSISGQLGAKSYLGVIDGNLPVTSKKWGKDDYLRALDISIYTSRAIDKRAEHVANIEFQVTDDRGNPIENDPVLKLLYKPNKIFTGRQFWKLYQTYYDSIGEVFIYKETEREIFEGAKITALHLLNPLVTRPVFNNDGEVVEYEMKTSGETKKYPAESILYIHNPDPKNPLRGQSLLRSGVNAISTEEQIAEYHSKILHNGGKVEGVFKFKTERLSKEQLAKLKDEYKKEYAEAKRAGIPLFLGGDSDYLKTGLTPDELSYLEAKKTTFSDICILTGVPEPILSMNDVKYDNADAAMTMFLSETIWPAMKVLYTALNEDLTLFPTGKNLTAVNPTPEDVEKKTKETQAGLDSGFMKINEARIRHGLDPVDSGDVIMVPFNKIPLESAVEPTPQEKAMKMKSEDGSHPLSDSEYRKLYAKVMVKRMDQREKAFKTQIRNYFNDQKDKLIETLQPNKTRVFRKKDLIDDSLNLELEVKIGKEKFIPIVTELVKQAGLDAFDLTGNEYQFNITAGIGAWIENRTEVFMRTINKTTVKELKRQFEESLANGEGREKLIKRIENTYDGINKSRAALIARTEVHNATQYGTIEGYRQSGLTTKIWVAVGDLYTRDTHAGVDGEERPIDMPFSNGLMFPGDPNGPAEEVINCRCVI